MRPAIRYHGGKWNLAPFIIEHLPTHTHYVEPFCGGASVLLRKPESDLETLNDLSGDVVNFFTTLRDQPERLIRSIELTPWARDEYEAAYQPATDGIDRARRFFVRSWMGIDPNSLTGWRHYKAKGKGRYLRPTETDLMAVAARLRCVQIEQRDALSVMRDFDRPDTLFYVDPPYPASTRSRNPNSSYEHEMGDHAPLLDTLLSLSGACVVSTYDNDAYSEALGGAGWHRAEKASKTNGRTTSRVEVLWVKP